MSQAEVDRREAAEAEERERAAREARRAREDAERQREEARRSRLAREQEERRLAELRDYGNRLDACRRYLVSDCDAAAASPHVTEEDRKKIAAWKATAQKFQSDLEACRKGSTGACNAALDSPASDAAARDVLVRLRAESSTFYRIIGYVTDGVGNTSSRAHELWTVVRDLPRSTHISMGVALLLGLALVAVTARLRSRNVVSGDENFDFKSLFPGPAGEQIAARAELPPANLQSLLPADDIQVLQGVAAEGEASSHRAEESAAEEKNLNPDGSSKTREDIAQESNMMQGSTKSDIDLRSPKVRVSGANIHGTYASARSVASLFGFFGWTLVGVGGLAALGGLQASAPFNILIVAIAVGVAALGMLQVAAQQMLRASVDSADYARQAFLLQIALAEGRTDIDLRKS